MSDALMNISPVDGRYERYTRPLRRIMSEFGLIKYRVDVMVRYVLALGAHADIPLQLGQAEATALEGIIHAFTPEDALSIKQLETKGWNGILATNHDVKSCELWLRWKFGQIGLGGLVEWIHFGCTSEDVNNIAYGLMLRDAVDALMEPLELAVEWIGSSAKHCAHMPMLSRTHGQPATPTTLGKEFAVFEERLRRQIRQIDALKVSLKLNGASGNYAGVHRKRHVSAQGCARLVLVQSAHHTDRAARYLRRTVRGNDAHQHHPRGFRAGYVALHQRRLDRAESGRRRSRLVRDAAQSQSDQLREC
jgi:adenylosuccinate lyase